MDFSSEKENHQEFIQQLELAQTGVGSAWMNADEGLAFAEYAMSKGFGVSIMEAYATGESRGKHALYHQILGLDDYGENWVDHRNATRALETVRKKFLEASKDALSLKYKFWLDVSI